ncbi:MAG: LysR family transcriptional regulator [Burkholderiaceae bacterium]
MTPFRCSDLLVSALVGSRSFVALGGQPWGILESPTYKSKSSFFIVYDKNLRWQEAPMLDFKSLETFLWVVNLRGFSAAAAKLATTQPAVSHRIAQLEEDFGVRLLERDNRTVTPTMAGCKLLAYAERAVKLRTEMLRAVRDPRAIEGTVRLGVVETLVHTWLPELVRRVEATYPRLNLDIQSDITREMRKKLISQELDLAFVMGPLDDSLLLNRFLCDYPMAFIASPKLQVPKPATLLDLARFRIMTFPPRTEPFEILHAIFNDPSLPPLRVHSSNALGTFVHLAIEALGVMMIPPIIVKEHVAAGTLEIIPTDFVLPKVSFTASWLGSPDTLAVELVADIAVSLARQRGE